MQCTCGSDEFEPFLYNLVCCRCSKVAQCDCGEAIPFLIPDSCEVCGAIIDYINYEIFLGASKVSHCIRIFEFNERRWDEDEESSSDND